MMIEWKNVCQKQPLKSNKFWLLFHIQIATKVQIKSMQKIQNRCLSIILKCDHLTYKKFILDSSGWLFKIKKRSGTGIFDEVKFTWWTMYLVSVVERYEMLTILDLRTEKETQQHFLPMAKNQWMKSTIHSLLKMFNEL